MADHAPLIPSFRDFSYLRPETFDPELPELPKPTISEVERALAESPAGKLGQAIDIDRWPWLERMSFLDSVVPGIRVHSLGGIAPFQADGIWGPYEWYYRERGGGADLRLAPIATFPSAQESLYGSGAEVKEFAGSEGWVSRFLTLWEKLSRSAFLYEFPAREVHVIQGAQGLELQLTGETTVEASWGHSPQEARQNAAGYHPYLDEKLGWTRELQAERRELMEISEEPINSDNRDYPAEDPRFIVLREKLVVPAELARFVEDTPADS